MGKRTLAALGLVVGLGSFGAPAAATTRAISGVGSVTVVRTQDVPPSYILATVELTNGSTHDFIPAISRFFLTTTGNSRFQGTDSGSTAFIGVANSRKVLKAGETRTYTVGFAVADPVVAGTVSYEP
jgi:hypothetical protein